MRLKPATKILTVLHCIKCSFTRFCARLFEQISNFLWKIRLLKLLFCFSVKLIDIFPIQILIVCITISEISRHQVVHTHIITMFIYVFWLTNLNW